MGKIDREKHPKLRGGKSYRQHTSYKRAILERDGYQCQLCGRRLGEGGVQQLDVAHIIPFRQGGVSTPDNMQVVCHSCNCLLRDRQENVREAPATWRDAVAQWT